MSMPSDPFGRFRTASKRSLSSEPEVVKKVKEVADTSPVRAIPAENKAKDSLQGAVTFAELAQVFSAIEETSSRLSIVKLSTDFFLHVLERNPADLEKVVYLFINRLRPDYEGLELGLGEGLIIKALSGATGRSPAQIKGDYQQTGDLGLVAMKTRNSQPRLFKPKPLTISALFHALQDIARMTGQASQSLKVSTIQQLLSACQGDEAKYLVRSLEGKLRIGLAEKSVLSALAHVFVQWRNGTTEQQAQAESIVREAFSQLPNYGLLIRALIDRPVEQVLEACKLTPGVPLKPMLAKPTKSITEVLDRFQGETFTCEYKYDGERAQVHVLPDGKVHIYSRNSEDMSQRFPDVISVVRKFVTGGLQSFILDCEAVAWDRDQAKILPFQILSTRKRKDVDEKDIKIRVCLFAFDLLYLNGQSLLQKPLSERRTLMQEHFTDTENEFKTAVAIDSCEVEDIQGFLDASVKDGCEGLMIKMLGGPDSWYEPSKRSRNWLKLKKDYLSGVGDSLDLVVLGAYYGKGKRTNVYGTFLLGCYNPDTEEYETVCKIGTGFSEEALESLHQKLQSLKIERAKSYVSHDTGSNAVPEVWFEPQVVFEVLTADLSLSPIYRAGSAHLGKGVSLRFPRYLRLREDKSAHDCTTSAELVEMFSRQANASH